jgi:epoxide hydrolase-like predicted phosphatase
VPITAVAFDIGDVLERVGPASRFLEKWRLRLGMPRAQYDVALASVDPDGLIRTGGLTEAQYMARYAGALGLSDPQAAEFRSDYWDWYCGELDTEMAEYAAGLRPRYRTAILSNSADGARREEQARYGFEQLVDVVVYSDEVGLAKPDLAIYRLLCARLSVEPEELVFLDDVPDNVEAARAAGIHGILHLSTAESMEVINSLLSG